MWHWFMDGLTKRQRIRRDAIGMALAATEGQQKSAMFLIAEAQRLAAWIEKGDDFLQKDLNPGA